VKSTPPQADAALARQLAEARAEIRRLDGLVAVLAEKEQRRKRKPARPDEDEQLRRRHDEEKISYSLLAIADPTARRHGLTREGVRSAVRRARKRCKDFAAG
jgi:hypothetical protein